jgi:acyl carrier protein
MLDYQTILETVIKTLARQLEISPASIAEETRMVEDLGADSLDAVELVMTLEEGYNIMISNDEASALRTVGQIAAFIRGQLEGAL